MPRNAEVIRQWTILRELEASRGATIRGLAETTGVTTRTIRRDLEALQEAGFPLYDVADDTAKRWKLDTRPFRRLLEAGVPGAAEHDKAAGVPGPAGRFPGHAADDRRGVPPACAGSFVPPACAGSFVPPAFVPPAFVPPACAGSFVPPVFRDRAERRGPQPAVREEADGRAVRREERLPRAFRAGHGPRLEPSQPPDVQPAVRPAV